MIIDISQYNVVTDFEKIKQNVDGVIIRMGYTGYGSGKCVLDSKWREYSQAALDNGIPRGAYYFPQSITPEEAKAEAQFIYNELCKTSLPLGLWLDSEIADVKTKHGRADYLTRIKRTELLKIIIDHLKAYGMTCGVYASTSWLNNNLDMDMLEGVPVWAAQWGNNLTYKSAVLWQYSNKGSIPGISGRVDLDRIVGISDHVQEPAPEPVLEASIEVIARYVIAGRFGVGHENRKEKIYELIKAKVNDILK